MALSIETSINPEHLFMDSHGVVQCLTDIFGQLYEEATPTHVQGEGTQIYLLIKDNQGL